MNKRIYLSAPHMSGAELPLVKEAFDSNWVAPAGPHIDAFEKEVCELTGAHSAAALSSGTAALHLALLILNAQPDQEVLCSTFTFAGSAFPATYVRNKLVFIDSDEQSWNMDPELLRKAIRERREKGAFIRGVVLVHLYGNPADIDGIFGVCQDEGVALIEDAAESLGAVVGSTHTGTVGEFGILSFNGNKIITSGGGGMLLAYNPKHAELARRLASQAREPALHYEHTRIGYNYRMSNIAAAIGRGQLQHLTERVRVRREIYDWYRGMLGDIPGVTFIPEPPWGRSNRWLTCITVDADKAGFSHVDIMEMLNRDNIESRPLWKPMHMQPVFEGCPSYLNGVSEKLFATGLCLPSGTGMTDEDRGRIEECIRSVIDA